MGQLILIGSDLDRSYFVQVLDDGSLEQMDAVTVYMSSTDAALRMSSIALEQDRLGQTSIGDERSKEIEQRLRGTPNLNPIDLSDAGAAAQH